MMLIFLAKIAHLNQIFLQSYPMFRLVKICLSRFVEHTLIILQMLFLTRLKFRIISQKYSIENSFTRYLLIIYGKQMT